MLIAVAAFSFEGPPALSSLLLAVELLPLSLGLSPPLAAGFLLGAMARFSAARRSEFDDKAGLR